MTYPAATRLLDAAQEKGGGMGVNGKGRSFTCSLLLLEVYEVKLHPQQKNTRNRSSMEWFFPCHRLPALAIGSLGTLLLYVYFWMSLLSTEYVIMLLCANDNSFKLSQPCSEAWGKHFCNVYWTSELLYHWLWIIYCTVPLYVNRCWLKWLADYLF